MILEDQFIESRLELSPVLVLVISVAVGLALVPLFAWATKRRAAHTRPRAAEPAPSGALDTE